IVRAPSPSPAKRAAAFSCAVQRARSILRRFRFCARVRLRSSFCRRHRAGQGAIGISRPGERSRSGSKTRKTPRPDSIELDVYILCELCVFLDELEAQLRPLAHQPLDKVLRIVAIDVGELH